MEVRAAPPFAVQVRRVVRSPGGGPQPAIPILQGFGRGRLGGQPVMRRPGRPAVAGADVGVEGVQLTQLAPAGHLDGVVEVGAVTTLRARLIDPPRPLESRRQRAALANRHRARALAVDVLAGARRQHRHQRVPAIAGGDQRHVNVAAPQRLAQVRVARAVTVAVMLIDLGLDRIPPPGAHVADRENLDVLLRQKGLQRPFAAAAHADPHHGHAVARRGGAASAQGGARRDDRPSERDGAGPRCSLERATPGIRPALVIHAHPYASGKVFPNPRGNCTSSRRSRRT